MMMLPRAPETPPPEAAGRRTRSAGQRRWPVCAVYMTDQAGGADWSAVSYAAVVTAAAAAGGSNSRSGTEISVRDCCGRLLAHCNVEHRSWTRRGDVVMLTGGLAVRFPSVAFADAFAAFADPDLR
jgi:hypothetical protein